MTIAKNVLPEDPEYLKNAFADLGLKEVPGKTHNPKIVRMYKDVGQGWVKDDETAWCAAFVGSKLASAGLPHTSSLSARSYLQWGKKTTKPNRGDVVVFTRGSGWQGHVAFYLGTEKGRVWVLGGNQSNKVSVTSYPVAKVLGYRTPVTLTNSRTVKAMTLASTGTIGVGMSETADQFQASLSEAGGVFQTLADLSPWFGLVGGLLIVGGVGWAAYARYSDWKEKAR